MIELQLELNTIDELEEYNNCKDFIEKCELERARGHEVRARIEHIEQWEKSTSFFFNAEKVSFEKKTIKEIQLPDGTLISDDKHILQETRTYYEQLYKTRNPDIERIQNCLEKLKDIPKLTEEDKQICEGKITESECKIALNNMKMNKSPGSDGLTVEFYKTFWPEISEKLVQALNEANEKGELSHSQRQAVISLLHKKNKDESLLKNWRPVSLLNVDYKILTKALSRRVEKIIPKIIHTDQCGFVKGRFIGQNIRLVEDLLEFMEKK